MMIRSVLTLVIQILQAAIFARVVLSWINLPSENKFVRIVYQITDPILNPIKQLLDKSQVGKSMMIDFSPLIALLLLTVIGSMI